MPPYTRYAAMQQGLLRACRPQRVHTTGDLRAAWAREIEQMNERKVPDKTAPMDARAAKKGKQNASLGREVQAKIGQQLRAYYDGLIEPTPDRFADLLRQLDKPSGKGSSG